MQALLAKFPDCKAELWMTSFTSLSTWKVRLSPVVTPMSTSDLYTHTQ